MLIPDMLSPDQIERIKAQVETLQTMGMDYSERQRTASQIMFPGRRGGPSWPPTRRPCRS